MKKIIALIFMLMPAMNMMAQNTNALGKKFNVQLDGSLGFGVGGDLTEDKNGAAFLGLMYNFTDNVYAGVTTGAILKSGEHYTNAIPVLATAGYRFMADKTLSPFVELYGGYALGVGNSLAEGSKLKDCDNINSTIFGARIGASYAILSYLGARASLNYNYSAEADHSCKFNYPAIKQSKLGFTIGLYYAF